MATEGEIYGDLTEIFHDAALRTAPVGTTAKTAKPKRAGQALPLQNREKRDGTG